MKGSTFIMIFLIVIAFALVYYFFIKPKPPVTNNNVEAGNVGNLPIDQNSVERKALEDKAVNTSDFGYINIPVDENGKVVPLNKAIKFIRITHTGEDCAFNYDNQSFLVRQPYYPIWGGDGGWLGKWKENINLGEGYGLRVMGRP